MTAPQEYARYPLTMTHPHHHAPDIVKGEAGAQAPNRQISQFPPVVVRDEQQEEYHAAQGYQPAGKVDPAAWAQAHAKPAPPDYVPEQYPKWVKGKLVQNAEDEEAVLAATEPEPASQAGAPDQDEFAALLAELAALKAKEAQRERMAKARAARGKAA